MGTGRRRGAEFTRLYSSLITATVAVSDFGRVENMNSSVRKPHLK